MFKHLLFYITGLIIVCSSLNCGGSQGNGTEPENTLSEEKVTINGFKYVHHIQNEGPKPQVGEYTYYNLQVYGVNDSISQYFLLEEGPGYSKMLPPEKTKGFVNAFIDVLPLMAKGDSVTVKEIIVITDDLDEQQLGDLTLYADFPYVNYHITLTEIVAPAEHTKRQIEKFNKRKEKLLEARTRVKEIVASSQNVLVDYKAGKLDNLIEKESGLKYVIHEEGKGVNLVKGKTVNFFYCGYLMDGTLFQNTIESGAGTSVQIGRGQSLPGWEEAMQYFKYGTKVTLFVPSQLAFGEEGSPPGVPPNADVMFYMEIME